MSTYKKKISSSSSNLDGEENGKRATLTSFQNHFKKESSCLNSNVWRDQTDKQKE